MKKVLFVCYGNIIRSQMAESFYNHFTKTKNAISASTSPLPPTWFFAPTKEAIEVMKEEGIDISQNKVKHITEEMVDSVDQVYVLTKKTDCPDFILKSPKVIYWEIKDPYNTDLENYRKIRNLIKSKVLLLV